MAVLRFEALTSVLTAWARRTRPAGRRSPLGHRKAERVVRPPLDPQLVAGPPEDGPDVRRLVAEVVARDRASRSPSSAPGTRPSAAGPGSGGAGRGRPVPAARGRARSCVRCFRPGPCCGNRHGQCLEYEATSVQPILGIRLTLFGSTSAMALSHRWISSGIRIRADDPQPEDLASDASRCTRLRGRAPGGRCMRPAAGSVDRRRRRDSSAHSARVAFAPGRSPGCDRSASPGWFSSGSRSRVRSRSRSNPRGRAPGRRQLPLSTALRYPPHG